MSAPSRWMSTSELIRVAELAPLLGLTTVRIYELIAEGEVPATRVGRALRAWLQRCTAEASRNAKQAAARRAISQPEPATEGEREVAAAVLAMAGDHPFGLRGSASELLEQLQEYRAAGQGDLTHWPQDGRSLAVTLRRLVVYLQREGVQVALGRRGYRGKRLVCIHATGSGTVAGTPSAASRRERAKAAPSRGSGSARAHADARDGGRFTGVLEVDEDVLASIEQGRAEGSSPTEVPRPDDRRAPCSPRRAR